MSRSWRYLLFFSFTCFSKNGVLPFWLTCPRYVLCHLLPRLSYSKISGIPEFNAGQVDSETPEQQTQHMVPTWWTFQSLFQEKLKFLVEGLTKLLPAHLPQHCGSVFIGRGTCLDKSTSRDKFNFKEEYCCLVEEIPKPLGTRGGTVQRETKWGRVLTRASQPWEHLGTGLLFNIAMIFSVWL